MHLPLITLLLLLLCTFTSTTHSSISSSSSSFANAQTSFLQNWIGSMLPLLKEQPQVTLLDLSYPGTHDSISYDLSEIVSEGGDDDSDALSWILHFASEIGITPGAWIRDHSKTQGFNVTLQLDNGVRFIDFRIMYTSGDWYCLHFMQSNQKALTYLTEIRDWLNAHPSEIVILWLSKHGSACSTGQNQYPDVSIPVKQAFWAQIQQVMGPLLTNVQQYPPNVTSISDLVAANQRVVIYASDYVEFTNSSPFAMDGCLVDNTLCGGVDSEVEGYKCLMSYFQNATEVLKQDKSENKFFLVSMASSESSNELEYSFLSYFIAIDREANTKNCAAQLNIPGLTDWCPSYLQDISQLTNYYNQLSLESTFLNDWDFPNAIYLDALDVDGTIRTGTQLFGVEGDASVGLGSGSGVGDHEETRYSYVANMLWRNLRRLCGTSRVGDCGQMATILDQLRTQYPLQRWEDASHGRLTSWPV